MDDDNEKSIKLQISLNYLRHAGITQYNEKEIRERWEMIWKPQSL